MTSEPDPRLGLPSASGAWRRRHCLGSHNLIRALAEANKLLPQLDSPEAASGTRIHQALAQGNLAGDGLERGEKQTLESLVRLENLVLTDWASGQEWTLLGREMRLWLHDGFRPLCSGAADVIYGTIHTHRMLTIDYKTLFGAQDPAQTNDQLRELVALERANFPACAEFSVALLSPNTATSIARYDQLEAELALRLLRLSLEAAAEPSVPRTPGAWCKYCPANAQCEEARNSSMVALSLSEAISAGRYELPLGPKAAQLLDAISVALPVFEAIRKAYKEALREDPQAVPGYYLRDGKTRREIKDVAVAWHLATQRLELELDEFLFGCRLNLSALEGICSLKGLSKRDFNTLFRSVLSTKRNAPELTRKEET